MSHVELLLATVAAEAFIVFLTKMTWNKLDRPSESLEQLLLVCVGLNLLSHSCAMALLVDLSMDVFWLEVLVFLIEAIGYRCLTTLALGQGLLLSLLTNGVTVLLMLIARNP